MTQYIAKEAGKLRNMYCRKGRKRVQYIFEEAENYVTCITKEAGKSCNMYCTGGRKRTQYVWQRRQEKDAICIAQEAGK
jgi:hypothetical protein